MYQKTNMSGFVGKAGEYAVASQLLARGIQVHFPAVDKDVDLIAGNSIRIQVKTSRKSPSRVSGYAFGLGTKRIGKHVCKTRYLREYAGTVDFLVCYGLDEQRFWVIPIAAMSAYPTVQTLLLGGNHKRFVDREQLYRLLASGMRQCDVAREMGIHPVMVSEFARGKKQPMSKKFHRVAEGVDRYEDAWQEIIAAVELTHQINAVPSVKKAAKSTVKEGALK